MYLVYFIFTYIYHKFQPNVGKYSIDGAYGYVCNNSIDGAGGREMQAHKFGAYLSCKSHLIIGKRRSFPFGTPRRGGWGY